LDQRGRPRTLFFEGFVEELAEVRKIGGSAWKTATSRNFAVNFYKIGTYCMLKKILKGILWTTNVSHII
jgi:hypothetical protein